MKDFARKVRPPQGKRFYGGISYAVRGVLFLLFIVCATPGAEALDPPHFSDDPDSYRTCENCHKKRFTTDIPNLCMTCHHHDGVASTKPFAATDQVDIGESGTTHRFDSEGLKYIKMRVMKNTTGKVLISRDSSVYKGDFAEENEMEYEFQIVASGDVGTATFRYRCRTRAKKTAVDAGGMGSWDPDADWSSWTSTAYTTGAEVALYDSSDDVCGLTDGREGTGPPLDPGIKLKFQNGTSPSFDAGTTGKIYIKLLNRPDDDSMQTRTRTTSSDGIQKINCAVCHNQHIHEMDRPYLRMENIGNALCKHCHTDREKGHYALVNGTSTGGSTLTVQDSTQSWTPNQWVGKMVYFQKNFGFLQTLEEMEEYGKGGNYDEDNDYKGFYRTISSNTATELFWDATPLSLTSGPLGAAISPDVGYKIVDTNNLGSHPVGVVFSEQDFEKRFFEDIGSLVLDDMGTPLDPTDDTVQCMTCHSPHFAHTINTIGGKAESGTKNCLTADTDVDNWSDWTPGDLDDRTAGDLVDQQVRILSEYAQTDPLGETGTATGGTETSLTDASKNWTVDALKDHEVRVLNETRYIESNTKHTITWSVKNLLEDPFTVSGGEYYEIRYRNKNWRRKRIITSNTTNTACWSGGEFGDLDANIAKGDIFEIVDISGPGKGYILDKANDETLCMTCHRYKSHFGALSTPGRNMNCRDCHIPHNTTNRFLIREVINDRTVKLRPGDNYVRSTLDGICQVCHTQADHWRNYDDDDDDDDDDDGYRDGNKRPHYANGCPNCHFHDDPDAAWKIKCFNCHGLPPVPAGTTVDEEGNIVGADGMISEIAGNGKYTGNRLSPVGSVTAYSIPNEEIPNTTFRVQDYPLLTDTGLWDGNPILDVNGNKQIDQTKPYNPGGAHMLHVIRYGLTCDKCHGHVGYDGLHHGGSVGRIQPRRHFVTYNFDLDFQFNSNEDTTTLGYHEKEPPVYPRVLQGSRAGTADSGTTTSLVDSNPDTTTLPAWTWGVGAFVEKDITNSYTAASKSQKIHYEVHIGMEVRKITGSGVNSISWNDPLNQAVSAGDFYVIHRMAEVGTSVVYVNRVDPTNGFGPGGVDIGEVFTGVDADNEYTSDPSAAIDLDPDTNIAADPDDTVAPFYYTKAPEPPEPGRCKVGCHNPRRLYLQNEPYEDMINIFDWAWYFPRWYPKASELVTPWTYNDPIDIYPDPDATAGPDGRNLPRDEIPDVPCPMCHDAQGLIIQGEFPNRGLLKTPADHSLPYYVGHPDEDTTNKYGDLRLSHPCTAGCHDPNKTGADRGEAYTGSITYKNVNFISSHPEEHGARLDCPRCHDYWNTTDMHTGGKPLLNHQDGGAPIKFDPNDTSSLTPFCLSCHDSNGRKGDRTPYSNNTNQVPDIKVYWYDSNHSANINCFGDGVSNGCHSNPHGSAKRALLAVYNIDTSYGKYFCFNCHGPGGNANAPNIQRHIEKKNVAGQSGHPIPNPGEAWLHERKESTIVGARHSECIDCHDPMTDAQDHRLKGQRYVDINGNPWDPGKDRVAGDHPQAGNVQILNTETPSGVTKEWLTDANPESPPHRIGDTGTATGGSVTTVADSSKNWTIDAFKDNFYVEVGGEIRTITGNTADTISWNSDYPLSPAVASGDAYKIYELYYVRQPFIYEVCFRCHGPNYATFFKDYEPFPDVAPDRVGFTGHFSNKRKEFDPRSNQYADYPNGNLGANTSYHPVAAPGRNATLALYRQLEEAFDLSGVEDLKKLTIMCTDCHNNEYMGLDSTGLRGPVTYANPRSTDKRPAVISGHNNFDNTDTKDEKRIGPHGSTNDRILRAYYETQVYYSRTERGAFDNSKFKLCFLCHKESVWKETDGGDPGTNFGGISGGWWTSNQHAEHMSTDTYTGSEGGGAVCHECHHNIHSNVEAQNTIYGDGNGGMLPPDSEDGILDGVSSTHLLNFGPQATGATALKPRWYWDGTMYRCNLYCHGANMQYCYYTHGESHTLSHWCDDNS